MTSFLYGKEIHIPRIHIQCDPFHTTFSLVPWRCAQQLWTSPFGLAPWTLHGDDGRDATFAGALGMQIDTKREHNQQTHCSTGPVVFAPGGSKVEDKVCTVSVGGSDNSLSENTVGNVHGLKIKGEIIFHL